jgi:hypothetical protein
MATTSVILDIRANTQKALSEFKAFSSQLDNKFLVSGLKLDVVRNALSQINREFQRSMGEQGLASAQAIKAAENQALILTNIYAGFSKTASSRIVEDFSSALSQVAVKTGSTISDIQKTLGVSPYLSRNLSQGARLGVLTDIQNLQTAARRAGLGGNAADILGKFLTGQTSGIQLQESGDALSKMLGAQLSRVGGGLGTETMSIDERTRILRAALANIDIEKLAKETGGFKAVLEQFSASLFNPKAGLLGSMRDFTIRAGEAPTNIFKETTKLFESIFGPEGFIKTLSSELGKAFGIKDDTALLRFLGRGIRFITNFINGLKSLIDDVLSNPTVQRITEIVKSAFSGIIGFFKRLDDIAKNPPKFPDISKESIRSFIKEIGENVRGFLRKVGAFIRGEDITDEAESGASIVATIVDEAGKTVLTFFREVGNALIAKAGTVALELSKTLVPTLVGLLGRVLSGEGGMIPQIGSLLAIGGGALGLTRLVGAGTRRYRSAGGIGGLATDFVFGRGGLGGGRRGRGGRGGRGGGGGGGGGAGPDVPPGLDDLLSSIRSEDSLDPMFANIQDFNERERFNREFRRSQINYGAREALRLQALSGHGRFPLEGPMEIARYGPQYGSPIGPLPAAAPGSWRMVNGKYTFAPYMGSNVNRAAILEGRRREIERRQMMGNRNPFTRFGRRLLGTRPNDVLTSGILPDVPEQTAARFNRRYGSGGTRALLGRRFGGFGRGALIAGGIGLGAAALLGGGSAQAAEIDPLTGEPMVGAGEAFGRVGMGAINGASMGAMFGPWGAVIGGVIGGGAALFDKGVRDAIGKAVSKFGSDAMTWIEGLRRGFVDGIMGAFNSIKNFTSNIDWGNVILDVIFPGRGVARMIAENTGLRSSGGNGGGWWGSTLDFIANALGMNRRAVGGPATRGVPLLVGERGPEIFTPASSGSILSNRELTSGRTSAGAGGLGGGITYNITINATGLAGNDIAAAIQPAVIKILDDGMRQANGNIVTRGATVI